jgi:hypothetical protein
MSFGDHRRNEVCGGDMTTNRLALATTVLCLSQLTAAEVDLSRPFEVDADTLHLLHFDDVASGQVRDAVPGGKPGVVSSGAAPALGRFGSAVSLDGVTGYVDITGLPKAVGLTALTVECWVKFAERSSGDLFCRDHLYMMRLKGTVNAQFQIDGAWRIVTSSTPLPTDRWTHLAMTYDQRTKEIRIYINGRLDVAQVPKGITDGKIDGGSGTLRLGNNTWPGEGNVFAQTTGAKISEFRVSSVARQYKPLEASGEHSVPENTNLLLNPGFESGMYGWRVNDERNALLQWQIQKEKAPQGRSFLSALQPEAHTIISYPFSLARGKTHTVSALMRADKPCHGHLTLNCVTGQGGERLVVSKAVQVTQDWQRLSGHLEVPANWPGDRTYLEIGTQEEVKLDIDAVSVVVGENAEYTQTDAQSVAITTAFPTQDTCMLKSGSKLPFEVVNAGDHNRSLGVTCVITDWQGRRVKEQQFTAAPVPAGQAISQTMTIPDEQVGWFQADFTVSEGDKVISQTTRRFNVIEPMKGVGQAADWPLGMNTHMDREPDAHLDCNLNMLSLCGVKWVRAWWGWGMAEKKEGEFDWTEYDRQFNAVQRAGMEIFPVLTRYYPKWEQAWAGPIDKPERPPYKLEQWGSFVTTTAKHYQGRVKFWEIWNEPNYSIEAPKYAEMLKISYEGIKSADPQAQVVGGGGVAPAYIQKFCEAGSAKFMDLASHHDYQQLVRPFEQMLKLRNDYLEVAEKFGATHRVWHSEQGLMTDDAGYLPCGMNELDCAVKLSQNYLAALCTGAEKFFWFSAQTTPKYGFAVFYENYVPRPRLVALNGLARLLNGRQVTGRMVLGDNLAACVQLDGPRGAAAAVWNLNDPVTVRLPASADVTVTDMLCNSLENLRNSEITLCAGHPLFILARQPGIKQLTEILSHAEVEARLPVELTASRTADGKLELKLYNNSGRSADLRLTAEAPELFTAAPAPVTVADLASQTTQKIVLDASKHPAAGTKVKLGLKIEYGTHGIRQTQREVTVEF